MDIPAVQRKQKSLQSFLLALSQKFGKETEENLKVFVADHGQLHDSGFLSPAEINQCKNTYELLMNLVGAGFMNPRDMSKLIDFLDAGGEKTLSKEVQEFQAQAEESCPSKTRGNSTIGERRRSFRCFLLELSTHFKNEAEENLRVFAAHHGPDAGFLASTKIEQIKTVFGLLMALVDVGFMTPHNMSNLIEFLESGRMKKYLVTRVQEFQSQAQGSISPRSSTTTAPPCGNSHADLQTHPPNEAATCQPVDQTRDEFMITPSVLPAKSQSFISVEQHSSKQDAPAPTTYRHCQASINPPKRSMQPSHISNCLPDDDEPPPLKQRRFSHSADEKCVVSQLAVPLPGVGRPYSLTGFLADIPDDLQKAMQWLVIGNYACVIPNIRKHLSFVVEPLAGDDIILDFELCTPQPLPIQALNHPAFVHSEDYESILQLIMETILIAPNPEKNLAKLLQYPHISIPESLKLLYRSRLPSVATDEKLREELACQCHYHSDRMRSEQQANFVPPKNQWYLAQVYDATANINKHQKSADFRTKFKQKAYFHYHAMQVRQNYKPHMCLQEALLKLESARSAQSQGYAYAEMATNGPEHPVVRREHAEVARSLHEEAINDHATPLLKLLHMHKGMSEGAALVANLKFDQMLGILRPAQLDYILYSSMWTEEERKQKLQCHLTQVVNDFERIHDQLSSRTEVVPVLLNLLAQMEESMVSLKKEVAEGCIKGFTLNNPTMSE